MNCKTLVTQGTEKQTLLLVSCNTSQSTNLKENLFSQTHSENVLINDQWKLNRNIGERVLKSFLR